MHFSGVTNAPTGYNCGFTATSPLGIKLTDDGNHIGWGQTWTGRGASLPVKRAALLVTSGIGIHESPPVMVDYFANSMVRTRVNPAASRRYRYVPLGSEAASNVAW